MRAGINIIIYQNRNFLSNRVVNGQPYEFISRQVVINRGNRVKRIRVILFQVVCSSHIAVNSSYTYWRTDEVANKNIIEVNHDSVKRYIHVISEANINKLSIE